MPETPQSLFASLIQRAQPPAGQPSPFANTSFEALTKPEQRVLEALCEDAQGATPSLAAHSAAQSLDVALLLLLSSALSPSATTAWRETLASHLALGAGCQTLAARLRQDPWSLPTEVRHAMAHCYSDLQDRWGPLLMAALVEPPVPDGDFPAFLLALPQFETLAQALADGVRDTSTVDAARRFIDTYSDWSTRPAPRRIAESAHRFGEQVHEASWRNVRPA